MRKDIILHRIKEFQFLLKLIIVAAKCPKKINSIFRTNHHRSSKILYQNYDKNKCNNLKNFIF